MDDAGHQTRSMRLTSSASRARDLDAARGRAHGAALALNRDDVRGLARLTRGVGEILGDELLAAQRDHDDGADVRMAAVRGQRVVGDLEIRPELAAAGEVGQRRADRRDRGGNPFGDDRGADDGRHDQHVIAHADPAVGPEIPEERRVLTSSRLRREIAASAGARHVVRVHVRAGGDVRRRRPDRAAVLDDRLARANRAHRDLVPAWNRFGRDAPSTRRRAARAPGRSVRARSPRCRAR